MSAWSNAESTARRSARREDRGRAEGGTVEGRGEDGAVDSGEREVSAARYTDALWCALTAIQESTRVLYPMRFRTNLKLGVAIR